MRQEDSAEITLAVAGANVALTRSVCGSIIYQSVSKQQRGNGLWKKELRDAYGIRPSARAGE
jgi:hypothetical protein